MNDKVIDLSAPDLDRYVGLKKWGWYLSQLDSWKAHVSTETPARVLEIGGFDGVSANVMLDVIFPHPQSHLTAIDPFLADPTTPEVGEQTRGHFLENVVRGRHENQITLVEGLSADVLGTLPENWFDFIYIDGSHFARHVLEDAVLSFPLLKVGGILGFDDYLWGQGRPPTARPKTAIDAFEAVYADKLQLVFTNWQRFFRKVQA